MSIAYNWNNNPLSSGVIATPIGSAYSVAGSNGYSNTTSIADSAMIVSRDKMSVTVPLEINGLDVEKILKDLMAVTGVISRNRHLEEKFKGLKKAGEQYEKVLQEIEFEAKIKLKDAAAEYRRAEERYKTFETIKDSK